jgi:YggT family protein
MLEKIVLFVAGVAADLLTFLFLLRLLMQAFRVSFANPLGDFSVRLTNWAVRPLRRFLPALMGLDTASFIAAWLAQCALLVLVVLFRAGDGALIGSAGFILTAGAFATLKMAVWVMIIALIAAAIISWVNPHAPLAAPIWQFTRPVLRPIQRVVPPLGGIDLSPLVAIIALQVVLIVLDHLRAGLGG